MRGHDGTAARGKSGRWSGPQSIAVMSCSLSQAAETVPEALPSQPTAGGGLPLYRQKGHPRQAGGLEDDGVAPSKRSRGR